VPVDSVKLLSLASLVGLVSLVSGSNLSKVSCMLDLSNKYSFLTHFQTVFIDKLLVLGGKSREELARKDLINKTPN